MEIPDTMFDLLLPDLESGCKMLTHVAACCTTVSADTEISRKFDPDHQKCESCFGGVHSCTSEDAIIKYYLKRVFDYYKMLGDPQRAAVTICELNICIGNLYDVLDCNTCPAGPKRFKSCDGHPNGQDVCLTYDMLVSKPRPRDVHHVNIARKKNPVVEKIREARAKVEEKYNDD